MMFQWLTLSFVLGACLFGEDVKGKMLSDLDIIKNSFDTQYAPTRWKEKTFNWNLHAEIDKAKTNILQQPTVTLKDFHRILKHFFASLKDYHVGVKFYSTEQSSLPFRVKGAKGRYFLTWIDRKRLSSTAFPFKEGDELVVFDGKPCDQVIQEFKKEELTGASPLTDQALAEMMLTTRRGSYGHNVPKGPIIVGIKAQKSKQLYSHQLIWDYTPETIKSPLKSAKLPLAHEKMTLKSFFQKPFRSIYTQYENKIDGDAIGAQKGFLPPLGKIWWQTASESPFYAYIFEGPAREKIGYIRIPDYVGDEYEVFEFQNIIHFFQDNTESLVIDQMNNGGGSAFYMYALASFLTDQPLATPRHEISITQQEVAFALVWLKIFEQLRSDEDARMVMGETFLGNPVTYNMAQFFINYFRFVIDEWNEGRTLTRLTHLYGIDHINPHPTTQYTKPCLLLVNSLDFSAADFFPAILQDNHRAVIMGTKTAGAGGYILSQEYPNRFGVAMIHWTGSIAERTNGQRIENEGITPDVPYEITVEDLQSNYAPFVQAILDTILSSEDN